MDVAHQRIKAAAQGDAEAYRRVVLETQNLVCSIAFAIVRDLKSSEEIAQDVFVSAWTGLKSLRSPDSFLPWLRQLARNRAQDHLRRRYRAPAPGKAALDAAADPRPGPEELLLQREREQRLAAAVEALPDDAREVVLLYYREGQSVAQVAALLDLSEVAVKKRLSRARERLREALDSEVANDAARTAPPERLSSAVVAALALTGGKAAAAASPAAGGIAWWVAAVAVLAGLAGTGAFVLRHESAASISPVAVTPQPAAPAGEPPPSAPAAAPDPSQVTGSVELPTGAPAVGALVRAMCGERSAETITQSDGGFQVALPLPGPCELQAEHGELHSAAVEVSSVGGPVTLALCEAGTVAGWVLRDDGPADAVSVRIVGACETVNARTDSRGRFSVTGGLGGHVEVSAVDGDLVAVASKWGATPPEVTLMLSNGGAIEGTVTGTGGEPVAAASVWLREEPEGRRPMFRLGTFDRNLRLRGSGGISESPNVVFETVTDANGHYRLWPVKRAHYSVVAERRREQQVLECDLRKTPQTQLNFRFGEKPAFALPVLVDTQGAVLAHATVDLKKQTSTMTRTSRLATGDDGSFDPPDDFAGPRHELLGPAQLTVMSADGRVTRRPVEVTGPTSRIVVEVVSSDITGVVVDDDGQPVPKAVVVATPLDPSSTDNQLGKYTPPSAVTDDQGAFTLHPWDDGRYRVVLGRNRVGLGALMAAPFRRFTQEPEGVEVVVRDGRGGPVRLSVGKRATIQGTVVDARGAPVPGLTVRPWKTENVGADASDALGLAGFVAKTDEHGAFKLGPCAAGTYWLGLQDADGHSLEDPRHDGVPAGAIGVTLVMRRQPHVAGRVVSHGRAVTQFSVNGVALEARDGRFDVSVYISSNENNRRITTLEVTAPGFVPRTLDLEMPEELTRLSADVELVRVGDQVRGVVLDEGTQEPLEGATVRTGRLSVQTGADGLFAFDEPVLLPATLDVTHSTRAPAQVMVRAAEKPVVVRLGTGLAIRGHVVYPEHGIRAHAVMAVLDGETHSAALAADGTFTLQGLHRGRWQVSGVAQSIQAIQLKPFVCAGPVWVEVADTDAGDVELKPK